MTIKIPKAVIFDLDDTLYSYQKCHKLALNRVQLKLKNEFGITKENFFELYNQANKEVKLQLGQVSSSHNKFLYFKKILEKVGFRPYLFIAIDIETLYWQTFYDNMEPKLGLIDFFETLRLMNIKCGILTNFSAYYQFKKIINLGLQDYIDHMISSEEMGVEKPQPQLFKEMISALEVDMGEVWMIGNNLDEDIIPGKDVIKATTFLIADKKNSITKATQLDYVYNNFISINKKLLKLNE